MHVAGVTRPPEPATLVMTTVPSSLTSPIGKSEAGKAGHVLVARVGEVAARDLARAFEQMPDERRLPEPVPVVQRPIRTRGAGAPRTATGRPRGR